MKALVALAATASAAAAGLSFAATPNGAEVLVTRDTLALPAGCSPRQVAAVVHRFFDAFNRGDRNALDRAFVRADPTNQAPGPLEEAVGSEFRWYSADRTIYQRPFAAGLFRRAAPARGTHAATDDRHRAELGDWSVDVTFGIRRDADDLAPRLGGKQRIAHGKGAIDRRTGRIFLWSTGMDMAAGQDYPPFRGWVSCPLPERWTPGRPAVACAGTRAPSAPEIAPSYRSPSPARLPGQCAPAEVEARVLHLLRAFNVGVGSAFARSFVAPRPSRGEGLRLRGEHITLPSIGAS